MKQHEMLIEKYFQEFVDRYGGEVEQTGTSWGLKLKGKNLRLVVSADGKIITFYTNVCKIPELSVEERCELFKKILQMNVVNLGAAYGVSENETIILSFSRPFQDLDFSEFNFLIWALLKNLVQIIPVLQQYMGIKEVDNSLKQAIDEEVNSRQEEISETTVPEEQIIPQPRPEYQPEEMLDADDGLEEFEEELIPPSVEEIQEIDSNSSTTEVADSTEDFEVFDDDFDTLETPIENPAPKKETSAPKAEEKKAQSSGDDWDDEWDF